MNVLGKNILPINEVKDFVTNVDYADLAENYASEIKGFRFDRTGVIGERDFGTKHLYSAYPSGVTLVNGYSLYMPSEGKEYDIILGVSTNTNVMRLFVGDPDTDSIEELTKMYWGLLDLDTQQASDVEFDITVTTSAYGGGALFAVNELRDYIILNYRTKDTVSIVSNTASSPNNNRVAVTVRRNIGTTNGLGWQDGDVLYFYKTVGHYDVSKDRTYLDVVLGSSPHARWMPVEAQNKITLYYGNSTDTPSINRPIQIRKGKYLSESTLSSGLSVYYVPSAGRSRPIHLFRVNEFINNDVTIPEGNSISIGALSATGFISQLNGWYIDRAHMIASYGSQGTASVPINTASTTTTVGEGIQITTTVGETTTSGETGKKTYSRIAITVLYFGKDGSVYQESDPIFKGFYKPTTVANVATVTPTVKVDLSKINRNIAGFRIYQALKALGTADTLDNWVDNPTDYLEIEDLLLTAGTWTVTATTNYTYSRDGSLLNKATTYDEALASGANTLLANLGHVPDTNRSYMTPRYAVRQKRGQSSVIAVDQDDTMLRLSAYSGDGVHMDDSFPDVTIDNSNNSQKIPLEGNGEILGIEVFRGRIWVFRAAELEIVGFDGSSELLACDCISKRSIQLIGNSDAPSGLMWAGRAGLWIASADGGSFKIFNQKWKNLYDGTKLDTGNVSYVSQDAREAIIVGYEPMYNETWVQIETRLDAGGTEFVQYRYNHNSDKWNQRVIDVSGGLKYFTHRKDGTLVIGYSSGLLQYPNRTTASGSHPYEDLVTKAGASSSTGINTSLKINIGSFYSLSELTTLVDTLLDYVGSSSDSAGTFNVSFYANGSTTAFQTITYNLSSKPKYRLVYPFGGLRQLEMKIEIPSVQEVNIKNFVLSRAELGYTKHLRTQ